MDDKQINPEIEYTTTRIDTESLALLREMAKANIRSSPMQLRSIINRAYFDWAQSQARQPSQADNRNAAG